MPVNETERGVGGQGGEFGTYGGLRKEDDIQKLKTMQLPCITNAQAYLSAICSALKTKRSSVETVRLQQTVPSELEPHRMTISSPFPYKQSPYSGWFLPPTQLLLETRTVTFCAFSSNNVKHPECITCVTGPRFPGSVQKILPLGGYGSLVSGLIHSVDLEKLQPFQAGHKSLFLELKSASM